MSQHHASLAPGSTYTTSICFKPLSLVDTKIAYERIVKKCPKLWSSMVHAAQLRDNPLKAAKFKHAAAILMRAVSEDDVPHHIAIIPAQWSLAASASCACLDFKRDQAWCKHIGALAYEVITRCEADPFYPFELRGFNLSDFMALHMGSAEYPIVLD